MFGATGHLVELKMDLLIGGPCRLRHLKDRCVRWLVLGWAKTELAVGVRTTRDKFESVCEEQGVVFTTTDV